MAQTDQRLAAGRAAWLGYVADTEGWLSLDEARWLHGCAQKVLSGCIVEVGAFRGRSTVALSAGAGSGVRVFSIDPHAEVIRDGCVAFEGPADRAAFFETMLRSGAWRNVSLLNTTSEVVASGWSEPVGLLWLDGDHSYDGIARDWACWRPHLIDGAQIVFDDAHDDAIGPHRLIGELLASGAVEHVKNVGKTRTVIYRSNR